MEKSRELERSRLVAGARMARRASNWSPDTSRARAMRSLGNLPWDSKRTSKGARGGACRVMDLQQEGVYTSGAERRETCS